MRFDFIELLNIQVETPPSLTEFQALLKSYILNDLKII